MCFPSAMSLRSRCLLYIRCDDSCLAVLYLEVLSFDINLLTWSCSRLCPLQQSHGLTDVEARQFPQARLPIL